MRDYEFFFRYAQYSHFKIYSEADYYKLEIDGYEGTAGDSLNDPWYGSNNSPFSTYNRYVLLSKNSLNSVGLFSNMDSLCNEQEPNTARLSLFFKS